MNIFSLTAPFPAPAGKRRRWQICFLVAIFVTLFLLVFQPFGIATIPNYRVPVIIGYGLVTLAGMVLVYVLVPGLFPAWFREVNWVLWKSLAQLVASLLVIATGNLLYSAWLGFFPLSAETYLNFIGITMAVGVFPGAASFFIAHYLLLRNYMVHARKFNAHLGQSPAVTQFAAAEPEPPAGWPAAPINMASAALHDEENRLVLQLPAKDLLSLVAADNYTEVFYLRKGELKKDLIRNSLKNMELQLSHSPQFYRCHRSYLINLSRIVEVTGNAQGYKVKLPVMKELVPVSRSRSAEFGELLGKLQAPKNRPLAPIS